MQQQAPRVRGYDIHYYPAGNDRPTCVHAWAVQGKLPDQWESLKNDPEITKGSIFLSAQKRRKAAKRQYVEKFDKTQQQQLAG